MKKGLEFYYWKAYYGTCDLIARCMPKGVVRACFFHVAHFDVGTNSENPQRRALTVPEMHNLTCGDQFSRWERCGGVL